MCCASYLACSGFSVVYSPKLEEFLPFMLLGICLGVISKFLWPEGVPNHFDHFITERCIYTIQCVHYKKEIEIHTILELFPVKFLTRPSLAEPRSSNW